MSWLVSGFKFQPRSYNNYKGQSRGFSTKPSSNRAPVDWSQIQIPLNFTGVKGNFAKSVLITAYENGLDVRVREDLKFLKENYQDHQFRARVNLAASKPGTPDLAKLFSHPTRILLHQLYVKKLLKDIPNIARAYDSLAKILYNEIYANVTAANEKDLANIDAQIKNALALAGKKGNVILTTKVDPSIVGGYIVEFDDFYADFSLKNMSNRYMQKLTDKENSKAEKKKAALDKVLNELPRSNEYLTSSLKQIENSFYERYEHLATNEDLILEEPILKEEDKDIPFQGIPSILNHLALNPAFRDLEAEQEEEEGSKEVHLESNDNEKEPRG